MEHITVDTYPSYVSGSRELFHESKIVFVHFHVIRMMNDVPNKIRIRE